MDDAAPHRLLEAARQARAFLEPHWAAWHRRAGSPKKRTLSQGTCGRSSLFVRDVLRSRGIPAEFVIGSPALGPQGYRLDGVWHGHAWVQSGGWIVDVTADQFGAPGVMITRLGDQRYKAGQDTAEPEFQLLRQQAARQLLKNWTEKLGEMHET
ncbi:transglutaminase domain-containing protein [Thalassobius sp. S69A]|uniref:transglutaminase domain-containing protein n=1 Tax=unclassified Thalassovita TaxID=2619711 RepID=UPI000C1223DD|nr:hypothetical protein [Paracoccaceae bacterium]MBT25917.1 hypothetical protein [Paracoccaceae bacterium]